MFLASSRALTWLPPAPPQSMLVSREKQVWACAGAKPCAKDPKLAGPVAWVVCGVARTPPVTHIGTGYLAVQMARAMGASNPISPMRRNSSCDG